MAQCHRAEAKSRWTPSKKVMRIKILPDGEKHIQSVGSREGQSLARTSHNGTLAALSHQFSVDSLKAATKDCMTASIDDNKRGKGELVGKMASSKSKITINTHEITWLEIK